jgi:hypothetical protein
LQNSKTFSQTLSFRGLVHKANDGRSPVDQEDYSSKYSEDIEYDDEDNAAVSGQLTGIAVDASSTYVQVDTEARLEGRTILKA